MVLKQARPRYLSVTFMTGLISFAQVELHPVCMPVIQGLNQVQRPFAQSLTNGIEEHKDQVCGVTWT